MITRYSPQWQSAYAEFLKTCGDANYCHDPAWLQTLKEGYGKDAFILLAVDEKTGQIEGAAPACPVTGPVFGRHLVCLPYLDYGGPIAKTPEAQQALIKALTQEAVAARLKLELRCLNPLAGLPTLDNLKVAMRLALIPEGAEPYWKKLDAKVRNQVRKAEKSAVTVHWGREEKLDDFYAVFCINMRDLGSPTHAKGFFASVLRHFPGAQIGTAYREGRCIGGLFRMLWKDTLSIPWASTLKEERIHCPNNALYWESIRYAFEQGCRIVDFGRSSKDEGTYKFKKQWLAEEAPLPWYPFDAAGQLSREVKHAASGPMAMATRVWAKLPLSVANALGPRLRGDIPA